VRFRPLTHGNELGCSCSGLYEQEEANIKGLPGVHSDATEKAGVTFLNAIFA
jgi:hypothetical protein